MADQRDINLLEEARTRRDRLGSALLFGAQPERRRVVDNIKRFVASIVIAAVASAACVGVSFVTDILAQQAAQKAEQQELKDRQEKLQKEQLEQQEAEQAAREAEQASREAEEAGTNTAPPPTDPALPAPSPSPEGSTP